MANTNSLAWPNMFNVAQNKVSVYEDNQSVVSRCRLLLLTEPTELYNEPDQGVGLKRYIGRYNQDNVKAEICDRCKDQFALHDPTVVAPNTQWAKGLLFTGDSSNTGGVEKPNSLEMTMAVETVYGEVVQIEGNDIV